jgi:hypothetical protein
MEHETGDKEETHYDRRLDEGLLCGFNSNRRLRVVAERPPNHLSRCTLKSRNFAVKSRTTFRLKFVPTLNAKSDLIPFHCNRLIPVFQCSKTTILGNFRALSAARHIPHIGCPRSTLQKLPANAVQFAPNPPTSFCH